MENEDSKTNDESWLDFSQISHKIEAQSAYDEEFEYVEDTISMIKDFSNHLINHINDLEFKATLGYTEQKWLLSKRNCNDYELSSYDSLKSKRFVDKSRFRSLFEKLKVKVTNFYNSLEYPKIDEKVIQVFLENSSVKKKIKTLISWNFNETFKNLLNGPCCCDGSEIKTQSNFLPFQSHKEIYSMKSFDNKLITVGNDKLIRKWDIKNSTHETVSTKHKNSIKILKFSPDKSLWASADKDGMVCIWKGSSESFFFNFSSAHKSEIKFLKFSKNDKFCFCATKTQILIWDLETNQKVKKNREKGGIESLWASDKYLVYTTCKTAKILSLEHNFAESSFEYEENITAAKICDNVCISAGKSIYIRDINTNVLLKKLDKHQFYIKKIKIYEKFFISCGADNFIGIWDLENYKKKIILHSKHAIYDIKILENNLYALSGSKTFISWNLKNFQPNFYLQLTSPINSFALDKSKNIIFGLNPNIIKIYDIQSEKWKTEFFGHCSTISIILIKYDFSGFVSADDKDIIFWDIKLKKSEKINNCHSFINCMALTPNDIFLASAGDDNKIIVWKVEKKTLFCEFETKSLRVQQVCCTNELIFSSAEYGIISVWNLRQKELIFQFESNISQIFDLKVSSDDKILVTVGKNKVCFISISETGKFEGFYKVNEKKQSMIKFYKFIKDCTVALFKQKILDQFNRPLNMPKKIIFVNLKSLTFRKFNFNQDLRKILKIAQN